MKDTQLSAVYTDPKTHEVYYIDSKGTLQNLNDLDETTSLNKIQEMILMNKLKAAEDL